MAKGNSSRRGSRSSGSSGGRRSERRSDSPDRRKRSGQGGQGAGTGPRSSGPRNTGSPRPGARPKFKKDGNSERPFPKRQTSTGSSRTSGGTGSRSRTSNSRGESSDDTRRSGRRSDTGKSFSRQSSEGGRRGARGGNFRPRSGGQGRRQRDESDQKGFFTKRSGSESEVAAPAGTEKMRLNRFIANSGVCSRREADELIAMGLISVNGTTITEMGHKVNPGDVVRYENKVLRAEKPVYILLNKPKGYLTTTDDPQERSTVMHIIGDAIRERIYPVGRLDRNTTGLLLLTNDGDLADKLMHPSYNVKKIYKVELDRPLSQNDFQTIMDGVRLEEGKAVVDDLAVISDDGKTVGIELHIGWNRVVRRIFEALNYQVLRLDRSVYAGLDKKDLPRGSWRHLTREEIIRLKHFK